MMPKIVFFGTSNFSAEILKTLKQQIEVSLVITTSDKPVGRNQEIKESPVAIAAKNMGLETLKPIKLKDPDLLEKLKNIEVDLFVIVAYGKIIPREIIDIPAKGCLNIHASLLPKYRGASPIHGALLNGEKETGISMMLIDEQMDHGPVLLEKVVSIDRDNTFTELELKLNNLAKEIIVPVINEYLQGKLQPKEQDHDQATYTKIISKEDGQIDWNKSAEEIYNMYRAYIVWPGIWTMWDGKVLKINKCKIYEQQPNHPHSDEYVGVVYEENNKIFVPCSKGHLELLELQIEGKNNITAEEFVRGRKNFIGSKLGN